ncbi:acyl carrier protein [Micromonospora sp. NPDC050276]|uniref:acyl carrier protein n=1 Tax=Micromonospora sp. NPDC050276 TaxID=3364278 RepID=UPI0037BD9457
MGRPDPVPTTTGDTADLTALIRATWSAVLARSDFTDDDSFFALGGHSMRVVTVMKELSGAVGQRLPTRLLFENQTVRELTEAVRAHVRVG